MPSARWPLRLLAVAFLVDALASLPAGPVASRHVLVPAACTVLLLGLSALTRGRMPGFGWGIGGGIAVLGIIGGLGALPGLAAALVQGVAGLPQLARVLVLVASVLFLLAGAIVWWRWVAGRPAKANSLTPIAWR